MQRSLSRKVLTACALMFALISAVSAAETRIPLTLQRVEPNTAPIIGGVRVTIIGTGFDTSDASPVTVFVDGQPCEEVIVQSTTRLSALLPAGGTAGIIDIEVKSGSESAILSKSFCYDDGQSWLPKWFRTKGALLAAWVMLEQGGIIMFPLALLSVFGFAWAVHCAMMIRPSQIMPRDLIDKIGGQLARSEIAQALEECQHHKSVFGRVAAAVLKRNGESSQKLREAAQMAGSRETAHLYQKISYLSNIGVICPMLGLLGTVAGVMLAFQTIGIGDAASKHQLLAAAIYKALITTAAGLTIGIPAMAAFYYFRGKLLLIATEMEQAAEQIADAASIGAVE